MARQASLAAVLLLSACSGGQKTICDLSMADVQDAHAKALIAVSRECRSYPELLDCPEAQSVSARYSAVWSEWERCQ